MSPKFKKQEYPGTCLCPGYAEVKGVLNLPESNRGAVAEDRQIKSAVVSLYNVLNVAEV